MQIEMIQPQIGHRDRMGHSCLSEHGWAYSKIITRELELDDLTSADGDVRSPDSVLCTEELYLYRIISTMTCNLWRGKRSA